MNHAQQAINQLIEQTEKSVIGQSHVVRALVIGLLTNGHVLLEGTSRYCENSFSEIAGEPTEHKLWSNSVYA